MPHFPVAPARGSLHLTGRQVAYAGAHRHERTLDDHTHSFVELVVVVSGSGVHHSLAGDQLLGAGDVVMLRPGVWHGYRDCRALDLVNCCFSTGLLYHELAWAREDPLLGHLLWTALLERNGRGVVATRLEAAALDQGLDHLGAIARLRTQAAGTHHADLVGHLSLLLAGVARAAAAELQPTGENRSRDRDRDPHPAVAEALRMLESDPARPWRLTDLAEALHLAPGYLVRVVKAATGLPPMAYLARYRVETAATLLAHTDEPISRIASRVGWPDQNYFARRFKAHHGMSASAYRASLGRASTRS